MYSTCILRGMTERAAPLAKNNLGTDNSTSRLQQITLKRNFGMKKHETMQIYTIFICILLFRLDSTYLFQSS